MDIKIYNMCERAAWILFCVLMCDCCVMDAGRKVMFGPISFRMVIVALTLLASLPLLFRNIKELLSNPVVWAMGAFVIWLGVSTAIGIVNKNNTEVMLSDLKGFAYLSMVPVAICVLNSKERIHTLMKAMMYACVVMGVRVLINYVICVGFPSLLGTKHFFGIEFHFPKFGRFSETIPRLFFKSSAYLLVGCAFATYFQIKADKYKWHYSAITGLCLYAMLMTYTRSIYLGAAVTATTLVVGFLLYMRKTVRKRLLTHIALSIAAMCLILSVLGVATKTEYFNVAIRRSIISFGIEDEAMTDEDLETTISSDKLRIRLRNDLLALIKRSPVVGNGLGAEVKWRPYNEYFYLDLTAKTGVCGLILYVLPAVLLVLQVFRKDKSTEKKLLHITWLCVLFGFKAFSYFNPYMNASLGILYYCCVIGACKFERKKMRD